MFGFGKKKDIKTPEAPALPAPQIAKPEMQESKAGLLTRLRQGLSKTSTQLTDGISGIFTRRRLDDATLEELEELLIMSDMGISVAARLVANLRKDKFEKDVSSEEIRQALAEDMLSLLQPVQQPVQLKQDGEPTVIMVVGVNGNGKTTTLGKLAARFQAEGKSVMLAAADTFRAAAVDQLAVWAERSGVPIVTGAYEADPASVAYQGLEQARAEGVDVLLIDTAGRLHNKLNLMQELAKISRVLKKLDVEAPHHTLMVLDGTTGQNALAQAATFKESVDLTGFVVTKLDGTAKGGMVVALAEKFGLPVHFIGVGEGLEDLQPFEAESFAASLVGLD